MKFTLVVGLFYTLVRGGESAAAIGAQCSTDSDCDEAKGVKCIKPFKDCTKGYCRCPLGDFGDQPENGICKTGDASEGAVCDSGKKTCNTAAKLQCTGEPKKCTCTDPLQFNETSGLCESDKTVVIGETCGADSICVGMKGLVADCVDGENCTCNNDFIDDGKKGCMNRISYLKDETCGGVQGGSATDNVKLCNKDAKAYIDTSDSATSIPTSFECSKGKCICPNTGKTVAVKLDDKVSFCKEGSGSTELNEICIDHSNCTSTLACGKCPGDTEKKCHKDMYYTDNAAHSGIALIAVLVLVGAAEFFKH